MSSIRTRVAHPVEERPAVLIGAKLRAARKLRSLTLDQVALAAGLTKGFVSRLERDDVSPSVASLVAVCDVLGLRVGELFERWNTVSDGGSVAGFRASAPAGVDGGAAAQAG